MAKHYVVVDVGCLECSQDSRILGIFTDPQRAEAVRTSAEQRYLTYREGEQPHGHAFEAHVVPTLDEEMAGPDTWVRHYDFTWPEDASG